jgi:quinol monooxygenase YgiN
MLKLSLFARLEARPGKEDELATATPVWFALRLGPTAFAIFDAFRDEAGRQGHLDGPIAQALMTKAGELLAAPPAIERLDVLGAKVTA